MATKHAGSGTGRVGRRRMLVVAAVALAGVASGTMFANAGSDLASAGSKASKIGNLSPLGCFDDKDAVTDTCSKHTLGLGAATALAISPDGRSIYVVSEGQTLVRAKRDPSTGKLSPRGCIEERGRPSAVRITPTASDTPERSPSAPMAARSMSPPSMEVSPASNATAAAAS